MEPGQRRAPTVGKLARFLACLLVAGAFALLWLLSFYSTRLTRRHLTYAIQVLPVFRVEIYEGVVVEARYPFTPDESDAAGPLMNGRWLGFQLFARNFASAPDYIAERRVTIPAWAVAVTFGLLSYRWRVRMPHPLSERRRSRGLCECCGYDLRFAGDRCPECGKLIPDDARASIRNPKPDLSVVQALRGRLRGFRVFRAAFACSLVLSACTLAAWVRSGRAFDEWRLEDDRGAGLLVLASSDGQAAVEVAPAFIHALRTRDHHWAHRSERTVITPDARREDARPVPGRGGHDPIFVYRVLGFRLAAYDAPALGSYKFLLVPYWCLFALAALPAVVHLIRLRRHWRRPDAASIERGPGTEAGTEVIPASGRPDASGGF
jgi:hypothetical protein